MRNGYKSIVIFYDLNGKEIKRKKTIYQFYLNDDNIKYNNVYYTVKCIEFDENENIQYIYAWQN